MFGTLFFFGMHRTHTSRGNSISFNFLRSVDQLWLRMSGQQLVRPQKEQWLLQRAIKVAIRLSLLYLSARSSLRSPKKLNLTGVGFCAAKQNLVSKIDSKIGIIDSKLIVDSPSNRSGAVVDEQIRLGRVLRKFARLNPFQIETTG